MTTVEEVKIVSDEYGFELHLIVGEDIETTPEGGVILNVQGVAMELLSEVVTKVGPWVLEAYRARRSMPVTPFDDDELEREPGESAMDYYKRTGNPDAVLEMADYVRDRGRGK